jgi:hypothetical protein
MRVKQKPDKGYKRSVDGAGDSGCVPSQVEGIVTKIGEMECRTEGDVCVFLNMMGGVEGDSSKQREKEKGEKSYAPMAGTGSVSLTLLWRFWIHSTG